MRALLDINVLLALFDEDHVFHHRAHQWLEEHIDDGWASCPLTQNGLIRIRSNPNYHPHKKQSVAEMIAAMKIFVQSSDHLFLPDDMSLLDEKHVDSSQVVGPRQITDLYLLALATKHEVRLVTFDEGINPSPAIQSKSRHLCII